MRRTLWIMLAVLLVAIAAPNARADSFTDGTLNFTVTSGSPPPTGSFVFDNTTSTFSSFLVDWNGVTYDFSFLSMPDLGTTGSWCGSAISAPTIQCGAGIFQLNTATAFPIGFNTNFTDKSANASGSFDVVIVTGVPEPSSVALMLLGVGLLFVMRKRIGQGLPQAS